MIYEVFIIGRMFGENDDRYIFLAIVLILFYLFVEIIIWHKLGSLGVRYRGK